MQEIVSSFDTFVVAGEGTIHKDERVFPWAADCLQELKAAGKTVLLLCTTSELHPLGLSQQFDSVGDLQTLANKRVLVVGDSLHQMQSARAAGLACALVCSGQLSEAFQLSPAPRLDVPANGGHFVEPDGACWDGICGDAPDYALACFAFSASRWQNKNRLSRQGLVGVRGWQVFHVNCLLGLLRMPPSGSSQGRLLLPLLCQAASYGQAAPRTEVAIQLSAGAEVLRSFERFSR